MLGKEARLRMIRRLFLLVPWALGLVLLLTHVPSAGDPIEALRQAELEARANYANALRELAKALKAGDERRIVPLEGSANNANATAQTAAAARRAAEARNIDTAKAATEARELSKAVADRTRDAFEQGDLTFARFPFSLRRSESLSVDELVEEGLREFDATQARKDFEMALEREAQLLDKEAVRLKALAEKSWASAETKAAAMTAREAANRAAARLAAEFGHRPRPLPPTPPKKAEPATETGPSDSEQPPKIDPVPLIPGFPPVGDQTALGTVGPPRAGSKPVSVDMTVVVDNRSKVMICIPPGVDPVKVATALGLTEHRVIAKASTGTIIMTPGDLQAIEAKAKEKGIALCFVEIDFCMIMTPLTAFRGHDHQAHRGGLHDHDAPDPPWTWSVTPPEPVVSWGGR